MKAFRSLIAALLLISVLFSTAGLSVYKHYCGDFLASLSFYAPADTCSDMGDEGCETSEMDCCQSETEYFTADLDLFKHHQKLKIEIPHFDASNLDRSLTFPTLMDRAEAPEYKASDSSPPKLYLLLSRLTYYG